MSRKWNVSKLEIQGGDVVLFANGTMQVAVNIIVTAVHPDDKSPVTLTDAELAKIELVDYHNPSPKLSDGWTYTDQENEFAHSMPGNNSNGEDDDAIPTASAAAAEQPLARQNKRYWVSTTKIETKSIATRLRQTDGKWYTTYGDPATSFVTLQGRQSIRYTMANTTFQRKDTANRDGWDQDNYFFSSKVYPFKSARLTGLQPSTYAVEGLRYCRDYLRDGSKRYIHYMWPMGSEKQVKAGATHMSDGRPLPNNKVANITINQQAHALCLTRLITTASIDPYPSSWGYASTVNIFDIYGNSGKFSVSRDTINLIRIAESNRLADSESSDEILYGEDIPIDAENDETEPSTANAPAA